MKPFLYLAVTSIVTIPTMVFAAEAPNYLVGIPGVTQGGGAGNFDAYIQAVYVMFISIAALLAVVKIIIAGLKYMFTDIVTQKGDAKKDIQGAVFGLLIVMSAVLILTVINPELTGFNFDQDSVAAPEPRADTFELGSLANFIEDNCVANPGSCNTIPCPGFTFFEGTRCTDLCVNDLRGIELPPAESHLPPRCMYIESEDVVDGYFSTLEQAICSENGCDRLSCSSGCSECGVESMGATIVDDPEGRALFSMCLTPLLDLTQPVTLECRDTSGEPSRSCRLQEKFCEDISNGQSDILIDESTGSRSLLCTE